MGINNFYKFIKKTCPHAIEIKKIHNYNNKILGIDANLLLYNFLYKNIIENYNKYNCFGDVNYLKHMDTDYEFFFIQLMNMISYSYKYNIKLLFVFDGKTPDIKKSTVDIRKLKRTAAIEKLNEFNEISLSDTVDEFKELIEKKKKLLIKSIHLNSKLIKKSKSIIQNSGMIYIDSPCEADSQCAKLLKDGVIDGIVSSDFDILTFGGKKLIINLFKNNNYPEKNILEINLYNVLKILNITYDTFIDLCILMGSDYSDKPKYSYDYLYEKLKKYKSYEELNKLEKLELPENCDLFNIRKYFKDCIGKEYKRNDFIFGLIDEKELSETFADVLNNDTLFNYINAINNFNNYWKIKNNNIYI